MLLAFRMSFGLALCRLCSYTGCYYSLICWPPPSFVVVHWKHKLTQDHPLSPLQNASCFNPSWFGINTSVAHFNGTSSAKLPFFQKDAAFVVIVHFRCGSDEGGVCMRQNLIFKQMLPPNFCL